MSLGQCVDLILIRRNIQLVVLSLHVYFVCRCAVYFSVNTIQIQRVYITEVPTTLKHNDYTAVLQYNVTVIPPSVILDSKLLHSVNSFVAVKGAKSDSGES